MIATVTGRFTLGEFCRVAVFKGALHTIQTIHGKKASIPGVITLIYKSKSCKLTAIIIWYRMWSIISPVDLYPSCLQATAASLTSHNVVNPCSLHSLPHSPLKQY